MQPDDQRSPLLLDINPPRHSQTNINYSGLFETCLSLNRIVNSIETSSSFPKACREIREVIFMAFDNPLTPGG